MRKAYPELIGYARQLRGRMTPAEAELWTALRTRTCGKFRRQHPIAGYILDFYCPAARLCVEVDGGIHDSKVQRARDAARTAALAKLGIRTIRFRNEEVLNNLSHVVATIGSEVGQPSYPLPPSHPGSAPKRAR